MPKEEFELLLPTPGLKRVTSEIDALLNADYVIYEKYALYSMPCRVAHEVAVSYVTNTYDENWIDITNEARLSEQAIAEAQAAE